MTLARRHNGTIYAIGASRLRVRAARSASAFVLACAAGLAGPVWAEGAAQVDNPLPVLAVGPEPVRVAQIEGPEEAASDVPALEEEFYPIDVPLSVNGAVLGDVSVEATLTGFARIDATMLAERLAERLSPELAAELRSLGSEPVLLERVQEKGLVTVYDPSTLSLKVTLPLQGVQGISLRGQSLEDVDLNNVMEPAGFAAGVSLIARPRLVHEGPQGSGWAPFQAEMRGFASVGGFDNFALLYELDYDESRPSEFQRGDITLVHDDFDKAIRYRAGDVRPSITGFQTSAEVLGVSVERNYGQIQPFRNLRPSGRTSFELERSARVSFEVNGRVVQTLDLEPGTFDIADFPLITGFNDVRVVVDDEFGVREVGNYSTFVDTALLGKGITLFGATAGVRRERVQPNFGFDYSDEPVAFGFYETGLSDATTLGAQVELSDKGGYVGGRVLQAVGESVVAVEAGVSSLSSPDNGSGLEDNERNEGYAVAATWTLRPEDFDLGGWQMNRAELGFEKISDGFSTVGRAGITAPERTTVAAQASFNRGALGFGMGAGWTDSRGGEVLSADASLRFPVRRLGANMSVGYQYQDRSFDTRPDETDHRFLVTLTRNFGEKGTVRFRGATNPDFGEVEWRRNSSRAVDSWGARAAYRVGEEEDELGLDATWVTPFAELDARHTTTAGSGFGEVVSSSTDFRIGVGMGVADGAFAFGRPVADGFVVATPHETLDGNTIRTMVGQDRVSAKSSPFTLGNNLLVPLTGTYREQIHTLEVENLPLGYDLGTSSRLEVFPASNSGFRIEIGSEPGVMVIGRLKTADGEPVSLLAGRMVPADGGEPIDIFTNRTGRFVAENTQPGLYSIYMGADETPAATLEVTEGEEGVLRVGTVNVGGEAVMPGPDVPAPEIEITEDDAAGIAIPDASLPETNTPVQTEDQDPLDIAIPEFSSPDGDQP